MFAVKSQPEEVFGLPNIKSAKKRVQLAEVRNARNKADKSALKTLDKSAAKGLLHKNNAAHKKSAMTTKLNSIG